MMPLAQPTPGDSRFAKVLKTEEKGSDVNSAAHLINDDYRKRYEAAVIATNGSDFDVAGYQVPGRLVCSCEPARLAV